MNAGRASKKVWQFRARAVCWLILGAISFPLGWANSVVLVWIASVYANSATDFGSAEAADDRTVLTALAELGQQLDELRALMNACTCRTAHASEGEK